MGQHGKHRKLVGALLLALLLLPPAAGAQPRCRIALSLGLDVSSSVDAEDYRLQAGGLAAALTAPEVIDAFFTVPGQSVALHIYEWSGTHQQTVQQDWVLIETDADLARVAERLRRTARSTNQYPTAIGYAMGFGATALANGPSCLERKLDISSDGTNNDGFSPMLAIRHFPFQGVTVNGLVIGSRREALKRYFTQFVIHGRGAFVEMAVDHADFERAMRRKLVRELSVYQLSEVTAEPR